MGDAEHAPDELEHRAVHFRDQTRRERANVDEKGARADAAAHSQSTRVVLVSPREIRAASGPTRLTVSPQPSADPACGCRPPSASSQLDRHSRTSRADALSSLCLVAHPRDVHEAAMAAAASSPVVAAVRKPRRESVDGRTWRHDALTSVSASRSASATIVIVGLVYPPLGNTDDPATKRLLIAVHAAVGIHDRAGRVATHAGGPERVSLPHTSL